MTDDLFSQESRNSHGPCPSDQIYEWSQSARQSVEQFQDGSLSCSTYSTVPHIPTNWAESFMQKKSSTESSFARQERTSNRSLYARVKKKRSTSRPSIKAIGAERKSGRRKPRERSPIPVVEDGIPSFFSAKPRRREEPTTVKRTKPVDEVVAKRRTIRTSSSTSTRLKALVYGEKETSTSSSKKVAKTNTTPSWFASIVERKKRNGTPLIKKKGYSGIPSGYYDQSRKIPRASVINLSHGMLHVPDAVRLRMTGASAERFEPENPRPPQTDHEKGMMGTKMFKLMREHNAANPTPVKAKQRAPVIPKPIMEIDILLAEAIKADEKYVKALKEGSLGDDEIIKKLAVVTRGYMIICLKFPLESQERKVEYQMWIAHHRGINMDLKRLKAPEECLPRVEQRAKKLCDNAVEVFKGFLTKLAEVSAKLKAFSQQYENMEEKEALLDDDSENLDSNRARHQMVKKSTNSVLKLAAFCYVVLGDLARYVVIAEQNGSKKDSEEDPDWSKPVEYYYKALQVLPGYGKAHNQRAVIASYMNETFDQLYFYIRALSSADCPYPSRENFLQVVEKNRRDLQKVLDSRRVLRDNELGRLRTKHQFSVKEQFMVRLGRICSMVYTSIGMEMFDFLWKQMIMDFQYLLEDKHINDLVVMKIVVMNIYSIIEARNREAVIRQRIIDAPKVHVKQSALITERTDGRNMCSFALPEPEEEPTEALDSNRRIALLEDLGVVGIAALRVIFDVLGTSISNVTAVDPTRLQFIEPVTVFCVFLIHHPVLASDTSESCLYLRASLATLLNTISFHSKKKDLGINRPQSTDGMFAMLDGFAPLEAISGWTDVKKRDLNWQFFVLEESAKLFLKMDSQLDDAKSQLSQANEKEGWSSILRPPPAITDKDNEFEIHFSSSESESPSEETRQRFKTVYGQETPNYLDPVTQNDKFQKSQDYEMPQVGRRYRRRKKKKINPYKHQVVVIDAINVAMEAGMNEKDFNVRGIERAVEYYKELEARVVAIIPEYYLKQAEKINSKKKARKAKPTTKSNLKVAKGPQHPDNVTELWELKQKGFLLTMPVGIYDESYCIAYARKRKGVIVSNNRYRNAIHKPWRCKECGLTNAKNEICKGAECEYVRDQQTTEESRKWRRQMSRWLRSHIIRYMFVNATFKPNPDYTLP